jgi:glycosidase
VKLLRERGEKSFAVIFDKDDGFSAGMRADKESGQFYEHALLPQQPDLNWRNPEVQQAVLDAMRFWLARG